MNYSLIVNTKYPLLMGQRVGRLVIFLGLQHVLPIQAEKAALRSQVVFLIEYTGDKAYFQWYEREALRQWIDANGGNVKLIGHSYGADTATGVVARGHFVDKLITVDPVGWFRPDFASVKANSGSWLNYDSVGTGITLANAIATIGGAWNSAPKEFAQHMEKTLNHVAICRKYCRP